MILNPNAASVLVVPHGRPAAATNHHGSLPPPPSLPAARLHIPCLWGGGGGSRGITKRVRARISMMMMTVPPPHKIFGATQVTRRQSSLRRSTHTAHTAAAPAAGHRTWIKPAQGIGAATMAWLRGSTRGECTVFPAVQAREGGRRRASCARGEILRYALLWWGPLRATNTRRGRFRSRGANSLSYLRSRKLRGHCIA